MPRVKPIGRLRHRVDIMQPALTEDSRGGQTVGGTPTTVASSIPASIEPLTAREVFYRGGLWHGRAYRVELRYRGDLTTAMYLLHGTRRLEIAGIENPQERNARLVLTCTEGPNQ
jgi:head-tail adaptor